MKRGLETNAVMISSVGHRRPKCKIIATAFPHRSWPAFAGAARMVCLRWRTRRDDVVEGVHTTIGISMSRNAILSACIGLVGCAFAAGTVGADTLVLKNGTHLEGDLKKTPEGWQITAPDGKV